MSTRQPSLRALLVYPGTVPATGLADEIARQLPDLELRFWPDVGKESEILYALVSRIPAGELAKLSKLRLVGSLHAGVDHLLKDTSLPADVAVTRPAPADGDAMMNEFILAQVMRLHRNLDLYAAAQRQAKWKKLAIRRMHERRVGVLGLGAMGAAAAQFLARVGFDVAGWARQPRPDSEFPVFYGAEGFSQLLSRSEILVNLLPLTPETENILNAKALAQLPEGASVINVGRGEHVVDSDLMAALDSGHLASAALDVFREEPLPASSPLWRQRGVFITPHAARTVDIAGVVEQFAEDVLRVQRGLQSLRAVDRTLGY